MEPVVSLGILAALWGIAFPLLLNAAHRYVNRSKSEESTL
jgi:hypothetical protein